MGAMDTAVSAIRSLMDAQAVAADNTANANAFGAKEKFVIFNSLVGGSVSSGRYAAGGVNYVVRRNNDYQGTPRQTQSGTDCCIVGNGFFVNSKSANSLEVSYSRAGHYAPDKHGFLQNAAGGYALGWKCDEAGDVTAGVNTSIVGSLEAINTSKVSGVAKPTTRINLQAKLPSPVTLTAGDTYKTQVPIYDSLGDYHDMELTWTYTGTPGQWTVDATCVGAASIKKNSAAGAAYGPMTITFAADGTPASFDGVSTALAAAPDLYITWAAGVTNASPVGIKLNLGTIGKTDGLVAQGDTYSASLIDQDGKKFGNFSYVTIDEEGIVTAHYDNGETLRIYRMALANFQAPNELQEQSGNSWIQTDASGNYVLSFAKKAGFGRIVSSCLETSTVDVAGQLTKMIEIQHSFSANTRSIKTADEMYKDLLHNI